jgi:Ca2+-binding EF-hand superfamily protein
MSVTLDTPFATGWITTWGRTFSSALADVTEVEDLCGLTVFGVEEDTLATRVHVRITEKDLVGTTSEFNQAMAWIKSSVADGSFLKALNRRGVPAKALSALAFKVTPGKARLPESVNRKVIEKVVKLLAQMPDAQLVAGFQQFDKNKNGKISVKELKDVVKYLIPGAGATNDDISAMVELVDTNQDGEMGVQEMLAYLRPRRLHPELVEQVIKILVAMPEEAVVAGFKRFDSNGNEKISADELKNVVNFLVPNSEVSDADLTAMIGSVDTETDGEVSLGELLAFLTTKRVNVGVVDKLLEALVTIPEELIIMGFKHFDADGSGTLKKDEIKSVISFLMPSAGTTDADLAAVVDRLDSGDKDGKVSLPEIISFFNKATAPSPTKLTAMVGELRKVLGSMSPEQITHGFNLFDSNKNGKLSVGETKDAIKALIPGMPVPDGSVKALVSAMDTDADGQVSLPELMVAIRG